MFLEYESAPPKRRTRCHAARCVVSSPFLAYIPICQLRVWLSGRLITLSATIWLTPSVRSLAPQPTHVYVENKLMKSERARRAGYIYSGRDSIIQRFKQALERSVAEECVIITRRKKGSRPAVPVKRDRNKNKGRQIVRRGKPLLTSILPQCFIIHPCMPR